MEPQCCAPHYTRSPPQSVRDDLALGRGEGACGEAIQRPTATEPIVDGPAVDVEPAIGLRLSAQGWACGAEGAESLSGGRGWETGAAGDCGGVCQDVREAWVRARPSPPSSRSPPSPRASRRPSRCSRCGAHLRAEGQTTSGERVWLGTSGVGRVDVCGACI